MKKIAVTIGYKEIQDNGNTRYFLSMANDGRCYKDDAAFYEDDNSICYISKETLELINSKHAYIERRYCLTDSEIKQLQSAKKDWFSRKDMVEWTKYNFCNWCNESAPRYEEFINHVVEYCFERLEGECFDTVFYHSTDWGDVMAEYGVLKN